MEDGEILSDVPSATYTYYQTSIKPKPQAAPKTGGKTVWRCVICGYIYEGAEAPKLCPVCEHDQGYYIRLDMAPYGGAQVLGK